MQSTGKVKANPLSISTGFPEDSPSMVPHPHSSTIEVGFLGIVFHAVSNDEVEVLFKLIKVSVTMSVYPFPHSRKVHWVFDDIQIVWDLKLKQILGHLSNSFTSEPLSFHLLCLFDWIITQVLLKERHAK